MNCIRTLRKDASHALQSKLKLSETQLQHKVLAAKANFEADFILPNDISRAFSIWIVHELELTKHYVYTLCTCIDDKLARN